ncbi:hypothetical protein STCU_11527 [Strigomonas culicis]|uniref:Uncharacterized protein n=1 Tax=Strigomonas culicis TaxID=28005 RepID=S9V067_9TRYP|nr:hypothetical protein STCU_11527 [Strigomonas culicis]|eukprot:EPY16145.1 hypothetical protein STCU_11527 [Strigomonas culicis]
MEPNTQHVDALQGADSHDTAKDLRQVVEQYKQQVRAMEREAQQLREELRCKDEQLKELHGNVQLHQTQLGWRCR